MCAGRLGVNCLGETGMTSEGKKPEIGKVFFLQPKENDDFATVCVNVSHLVAHLMGSYYQVKLT